MTPCAHEAARRGAEVVTDAGPGAVTTSVAGPIATVAAIDVDLHVRRPGACAVPLHYP